MTGATSALLVTLVVEVPIVVAFYPRMRTPAIALAINVLTNSGLNRVWLAAMPVAWSDLGIASGELLSFALEAFVYARWLRRDIDRALVASGAANLASFALAPLVMDSWR